MNPFRVSLTCALLSASLIFAQPDIANTQDHGIEVSVFVFEGGASPLAPQQADVVVRDGSGRIVFSGKTDIHGYLLIPLDYRAVDAKYEIEARLDLGHGDFLGGCRSMSASNQRYVVLIPSPAAVSVR